MAFVLLGAPPVAADPALDRLIASTERAFSAVPPVVQRADIGAVCGGGAQAPAVYCPSENRIFVRAGAQPYALAHVYGHALQVRYGIADIALRTIQANRPRETELRGMVTRQVECFAGMLMARAGLPPVDFGAFPSEPFTGSHWGRNPVRDGPSVSIGAAARARWFDIGYQNAGPSVCSVDEMSAELVVSADALR